MPQTTTTMIDLKSVLRDAPIVPSFAVKDLDRAYEFYGTKLGLNVRKDEMGVLEIRGQGGRCSSIRSRITSRPSSPCSTLRFATSTKPSMG